MWRAVLCLLAVGCSTVDPVTECTSDADCFESSGYKCDAVTSKMCVRACHCDGQCLWGQRCAPSGICIADTLPTEAAAAGGDVIPSCSTVVGGERTCTEFRGAAFDAAEVEVLCPAQSATAGYHSDGCPSAGAVGPCLFFADQAREARVYLYESTAVVAQDLCATPCGGQWSP